MRAIQGGLAGRELLLAALQGSLLRAIQLGLCALKALLRRLQVLLRLNALVGDEALLRPLQLALRGLEGLLSPEDLLLLCTVQRRLAALEFLPRALQRGVGGDLLVGQHDLGRALLLGLGGLEGLCRALQADLLRPVELILRSLKALLALLQDP